jgi:hypothetical protein
MTVNSSVDVRRCLQATIITHYIMLSDISTSRPESRTATLTFAKVFSGKKTELAQKLDVTDELLRKLEDAKIIDEASFQRIKKLMTILAKWMNC